MAGTRSKIQEDVRFRMLRLLQENPELSQRDLAEAIGISVGGTHNLLSTLIDKGLVKIGNFTASDDKRRFAYVLTPQGLAEMAVLRRTFLARKISECEALRVEIENLQREVELESDMAPHSELKCRQEG